MFCFRKFIFVFPLSFLMNGCGYTIPDYVDAQRLKNTPQFITIAKEQHYQPLSIRSISEIASNQNFTAYICATELKSQVCVLAHHQPFDRKTVRTIDIPIAKAHESFLLLNGSDHLIVLSKDLSFDNNQISNDENSTKPRSIIGFEIDLNIATVQKLDIVDGEQIKNELIDSLLQENKYQKKNEDKLGFDGVIYEEMNHVEVSQPTHDSDANELTLLNILEAAYEITLHLVKGISNLFQDLSTTLIYESGYTISDQPLTLHELPESFPKYFQDKVLSLYAKVDCLRPFSPHQMDYLIQQKNEYELVINTPMIDTLVKDQKNKLCDSASLQDVTLERIIQEVVTGNRSSGNHYVGGYSAEGFNIFELNNVKFQAPLNELNIYEGDYHTVIEFPKSSFYLAPK